MRGGPSATERGVTYEQAVRVWRLAELIRGNELADGERTLSIMFQDPRYRPWDDLVETCANGTVVGWQVKDLSEPLPDATVADLLRELDSGPAQCGVLALSRPVLGGKGSSIVGLERLADDARAAHGELSRWELRDRVEQDQFAFLRDLVYENDADADPRLFSLLARLRVLFLSDTKTLLRRASDGLGRFFEEPDLLVTELCEYVHRSGVRGVRIDLELLQQELLSEFSRLQTRIIRRTAPSPTDSEVLLWSADERGVGRTIWLSPDGTVSGEARGVFLATKHRVWRVDQVDVPVPILQCDPFDDFDHEHPPVQLGAVRSTVLRDLCSAESIPLTLRDASDTSWLLDARQEVALLGSVGDLLLVRLHLWEDGGGTHPMYGTSFRVVDLSGAREIPLWFPDEARTLEDEVGLDAVNRMRHILAPNEPAPFKECKLTLCSLRVDNELRLRARLQFTADVCHADADETWDDYSASTVVETDRLPKLLQQYAEPPAALQRYWEQHPLPASYSGWCRVPVAELALDRLRAELQRR